MTKQTQDMVIEDLKDRIANQPADFYYCEDDMTLEYFGLGRRHKQSHKKRSKK